VFTIYKRGKLVSNKNGDNSTIVVKEYSDSWIKTRKMIKEVFYPFRNNYSDAYWYNFV
jgi:hypothetical protein